MAPSGQPPHIGIVCDYYGWTLLPKSGIGVFVYNLIDGLLTLTPCPKITILAHPGDQEELEEWAKRWENRVRILPSPEDNKTAAGRRIERGLKDLGLRCLNLENALCCGWDRVVSNLKQRILTLLKGERETWRSSRRRIPYSLARMVLWATLLGVGSWMVEILHSLILGFLVPTLLFPILLAQRVLLVIRGAARPLEVRIAAADCDVWLVPYAGIQTPILAPHVLVIFDMVFRHVPQIYSPWVRDRYERLFAARAREATLIYCGSNFVKEHDLVPCFPFAADRIRVFRLAPPMDVPAGAVTLDLPTLCRKYRTGSQFLFYPAALRAHKNHAMLVRALTLLCRKHRHSALELVFTGECRASLDLLRLVSSEGLTKKVHFLGVIDRQDIQAFYQHALVVPLPSLHEGYGLPLLEALQNQCPVVCADIPAFRELLEDQSETVLFFDPHEPGSIAEAVSLTISRRDEFRDRQREAYRKIARRDWHAVAQDFLHIFEEARHLAGERQRPSSATFGSLEEMIRHVA